MSHGIYSIIPNRKHTNGRVRLTSINGSFRYLDAVVGSIMETGQVRIPR